MYFLDQHHLYEAIKKSGTVKTRISKAIVQGPARSGKTSVKCLILGQLYTTNISTGCIESPQIAVGEFSMSCYGRHHDEYHWELVDSKAMVEKFASEIRELISKLDQDESEKIELPPKLDQQDESGLLFKDDYQPTLVADADIKVTKPLSSSQTFYESFPEEVIAVNDVTLGLSEMINKACVKANRLTLHKEWLYFIDCGGQIQFQQLVQAFIPCASVLMLVTNLAEDLSSQSSTVFQCDDECYSVSDYSPTVEILLKRLTLMVTSSGHQQQIAGDIALTDIIKVPEVIKLVSIATHRDEYDKRVERRENVETIEKKEEKLGHIFQALENNLSYYDITNGKILYEVDGRKASKGIFDDPVIRDICAELRGQAFEVAIPLSWYAFEILLRNKSFEGCGVLSLEDCQTVGRGLGLSNEEIRSALKFFHLLNTILYYPGVSNLVFVLPHNLIEVIHELVVLVCKIRAKVGIGRGTGHYKKIVEQGIISKDVFNKSTKCSQISASFSNFCVDLLKIFKHLLIATEMSGDEFFMPALLPLTDPSQTTPSSHSYSLLYYFKKGVPLGLFCAMIVNLLLTTSDTDNDLYDNSVWTIECTSTMYANLITLQHCDMRESVIFVESNDCYEIHFQCEEDKEIGEKDISSILKETIEKRKFDDKIQPKKAVLCQCLKQPRHAAIVHKSGRLRCTISGKFVGKQSNIFLSFSLCIIFIINTIRLFESNTLSGFCYFSLDTASETIEMSRQPDLTSHQHKGNCYRII